jgi:thiol:disulfide interchange protein DsbD
MGSLTIAALALALPMEAAAGDHLRFELVPAFDEVTPGGDILIGVRQIPDSGWHSYWQNPGDTGLATEVSWQLPEGVIAGPVQWPVPDRLPTIGGTTYGYAQPATLLVRLHVGAKVKPGAALKIAAHVDSLVCESVCEPVRADLERTLTVSSAAPAGGGRLAAALRAFPTPLSSSIQVEQRNGFVKLSLADVSNITSASGAYLFAEEAGLIDPSSAQTASLGARGLVTRVKDAGKPWPKSDLHFVLKMADGAAYRLIADAAGPATPDPPEMSLLLAMVLAFAGGLILNLMPCVFPILSMKLLALTRSRHDGAMARREALVYGLGAILSFLALALIPEVTRALGGALGWGFQLQSPFVTAGLSILLLLIALNMSGLFEVGASLQALAGSFGIGTGARQSPYAGAFLTGVLAVVVAAPCTAPFMATAVGVALSQGGLTSLAIFIALGLGFIAPFIALTFAITVFPAAAKLIPKPGRWMVRLRHLLAVPMYAAALWMVWVFAQQANPLGLFLLLASLALVTLSLLRLRLAGLLRAATIGASVGLALVAASQSGSATTLRMRIAPSHQVFSAELIASLRAQNRPVLVDLTAAWCITCKVNEALVLTAPEVNRAMEASRTVYMVGDWTRQDPTIGRYLAQFGRSGVPLYVYYAPGGEEPIVLPQILSAHDLIATLEGEP